MKFIFHQLNDEGLMGMKEKEETELIYKHAPLTRNRALTLMFFEEEKSAGA